MLDDQKIYQIMDSDRVGDSIQSLPLQIMEAYFGARKEVLTEDYCKTRSIVVNGMGGSNLGARIMKSAFADRLSVPVIVEPGYDVPAYVGKDTLYVISSYSGTTEEPLSTYVEAKKRGAKIWIVSAKTTGKNALADLMAKEKLPGYLFDARHNPSGQPRFGVGYSIASMIGLASALKFIRLKKDEIKNAGMMLEKMNLKLAPDVMTGKNQAKALAEALSEKIPLFIAGGVFEGSLHAMRNQLNESSKNLSIYLTLPELNHYAFDGFAYPAPEYRRITVVFFDSELYHPRVALRQQLTKRIIKKNNIDYVSVKLTGRTKLEQAMELLQFGSWLSYYLGILNNADPVDIEWVNWFKNELSKDKYK